MSWSKERSEARRLRYQNDPEYRQHVLDRVSKYRNTAKGRERNRQRRLRYRNDPEYRALQLARHAAYRNGDRGPLLKERQALSSTLYKTRQKLEHIFEQRALLDKKERNLERKLLALAPRMEELKRAIKEGRK